MRKPCGRICAGRMARQLTRTYSWPPFHSEAGILTATRTWALRGKPQKNGTGKSGRSAARGHHLSVSEGELSTVTFFLGSGT